MASELMTATVRLTKAVSVVAAALLMLPINAQAENSYFYDKLIAESKIDARYAPTVGVVCSPLSRTLTYDVYFSNPAWKDYIITYRGTTAQSCTPHDAQAHLDVHPRNQSPKRYAGYTGRSARLTLERYPGRKPHPQRGRKRGG